ncbi:chromosome segregation protein SMC [Rubellimicrobium rubrum]|uniref:Chromosome partition protein Smc n=1 Tax=Rubellimicrobium rubrum TaxID=2585369 RepID=A0A5C4N373_9RHOB|nr:AAA family ATPase [Rubellimicrobium rubrum]TNC52388.1 chromosome segregation protein SMC [Rubellimicrobium rubrum]
MRLTRLRLNGFKSFADPTELHIAPGLTGVVGPNGCGKSNLLEALRWVMGETRPTQMRGQGMEDVIFAGTTRRGARAWGEVALAFERDGTETEIVRRIARDGGSAYRLAGKEARARDIQVMFADAASGAQSPALVRQGQISELIGQKPTARRRVIEEAAGVAGLQARRAEASQRLNAAEANLQKLEEVTGALADRLRALERQARNAQKYRELAAAIRVAEGQLLWHAFAAAQEVLAAAEGDARTRAGLAARAEEAALEAAQAREAAEDALPPLRAAAAEGAQAATRLRTQGEAEAAEARRAAQRLRDLEKAAEDMARDEARESGLAREALEALVRLRAEGERLGAAAEGEAEQLEAAAELSEAAADALQEAEAALQQATEVAARVAAQVEAAERQVQDLGRARDRAAAEAARATLGLTEAEAALRRAEAQGEGAAEIAAEAEEALANADEALTDAEAALAPAREADATARAGAAEAQARAAGLAAEARTLGRLVAADGSRAGQVGEGLRVPEGLEAAVAAALGRDLRAPVVEEGSGWTRLPPYDGDAGWPQGVRALSALVEAPPELARRLSRVGLVEAGAAPDLWTGLRPGQRLVTRDGDLWRWDGFCVLATDAAEAAAEAEAMRRASRLPGLRSEAEEAAERAEAAKAVQDEAARSVARANAAAEAARNARRAAERQAQEAARVAGRTEADRALAQAKGDAARDALGRARAALEETQAALSQATELRAGMPDARLARMAATEAGSRAGAARAALLAARAAEEDRKRAAAGRARRLAEIAREDGLWSGRHEAAQARAVEMGTRRDRLAQDIAEAADIPAEIAARQAEIAAALEEAQAARHRAEARLAEGEMALRGRQDAERMAERAASEAREVRAGAEAARVAAADRALAAGARIREERDLSPRELLDTLGDPRAIPAEAAVQADLAALRRRRDAIGPVNLRAEEDARALREEQDVLVREAADLSAAVAELRQALSVLNREGRDRMREAFGRVNAEFGRLFRTLFGGGEARLTWVDGDDPLEAGVEIMAQPPGKTLGTLSLLSGGEQTLTALALIFAVFLVAPAPVCVLDEVDAPLDDANVGRFCDLLDAMARETQTRFLVITHHAVTMARMDRLYGVTMAERGVSQLVSVDLRAAEAMVA